MPSPLVKLSDADLSAKIKATQEEVATWWELLADASAFGVRLEIDIATKNHRNAQSRLGRLSKEQTRRWREKQTLKNSTKPNYLTKPY